MGMTIDEHIAQLKKLKSFHNGSYGASINFALDTMRKYKQLQADYENRLKADLVAMLTEIQLEIEEDYWKDAQGQIVKHDGWNDALTHDVKVIQQKINSLKEA